MRFKGKTGQAGSAAAFIAMIAGFILLYIILLPPAEREALLGDNPSGSFTGDGGDEDGRSYYINSSILSESPGRINYLKFGEYDHPLPAVNLYTLTNSKENMIGDSVFVKNGVFDKKDRTLNFDLPDTRLVNNVYLTFDVNKNRDSKGQLLVSLNDKVILERDLSEIENLDKPIKLENNYLSQKNELTFSVSSVGFRFWTTNNYELDDIRLIYELTDISQQSSKNTFMITDSEKHNLEKGIFKFNPDCTPSQVGILTTKLNNHIIYSSVPDCGQLNLVEVSIDMLEAGKNTVVFQSERGHYLIDNINMQTQLKKMTYPVYYFDMDDRLFNTYKEDDDDEECGDVDGVCPVGCPEYLDKDCCLGETSKYWCDMKTDNVNERCKSVLYISDCDSCATGYEDSHGDSPEVCEDLCGDDNDNDCPSGCNALYDKDCCFDQSETNYWCDDVPKYGLSNVCKAGIHLEDCDDCVSGYETEEGTFDCPLATVDFNEKSVLKTKYDAYLVMKFLDDGERKAARIFVNGRQFYMDTTKDEYKKKIDDYVEDGSNGIKIEPDRATLDIIKLDIELEKVR